MSEEETYDEYRLVGEPGFPFQKYDFTTRNPVDVESLYTIHARGQSEWAVPPKLYKRTVTVQTTKWQQVD